MKAILIDAVNRKVELVMTDGHFRDMQRQIGCDIMTVGTYLENEDFIYVDDEGLLNGKWKDFFFIENKAGSKSQFFAGNGLVLASNEEGESVDVKTSVEDLTKMVRFLTLNEVLARIGE